ncbi:MAG: SPOR domain-containing protein [Candidatus Marinimicrobia bacterium]|jgi:cell division septation protein DedD|nr:SPOR domain-containing protein [Candidatus Neomarinimicrobiota bacterium]|tara:strand:- start:14 stop:409 length:396 start_codon:yes stop_codon:yes gene_type:complete
MIRYFLLLIISSSILFTQELNDKWLNTILEKNVPDMVTTPTETLNKQEEQTNNTYFTIQVAAKATFADAEDVVKILNNYNFEAFIQKNDSNEKLKYRVRYGSFLSREDASMTANDIRNQLGYDCWVDKIEL